MIALDIKSEQTSSSPLSLNTPEQEPKTSFAELLKGVKIGKKGNKVIQNGALVLSLAKEGAAEQKDVKVVSSHKNSALKMLLKNDNDELEGFKSDEMPELNPKLTSVLSVKELKTLIVDAKKYLKSQILKSDGYKNLDPKQLPKTLKGLAVLAKKIGIDVSKITVEEVQVSSTKSNSLVDKKLKQVSVKDTNTKTKKLDINQKTEIAPKVELKNESKIAPKVELKNNVHQESKIVSQDIPKSKLENTTLFKPQISTELVTEHTTEQLVMRKQQKVEQKTPKDRANETLQLLLRGEKPSSEASNLTADFSVQTAKVIAPSASTETSKSLESLLHEKPTDDNNHSKADVMTVHKADSFEVKLNEAKQMIKYLSQDVKSAIEDYKSPFTRVKVQLNPQKLGEIDVTVIQRGKNLHVNLSSNNTAINTLSMNANELKVQLQNSGINNATLNFSNSSQNGEQAQQQNHQNQQKTRDEYNYFEAEEEHEEILSSLEIVVPNYA